MNGVQRSCTGWRGGQLLMSDVHLYRSAAARDAFQTNPAPTPDPAPDCKLCAYRGTSQIRKAAA
jgi:hypothetical protein